jgi:hypothetical protein
MGFSLTVENLRAAQPNRVPVVLDDLVDAAAERVGRIVLGVEITACGGD